MNKQLALGTLTKDASLINLENGRQRLGFTLSCKEGMNGDTPINSYIPVAVFGAAGFADEFIAQLKEGEAFSAHGKLVYERNEKNSNVYTNAGIELRYLSAIRPAGKGGLGLNRVTLIGNLTADARINGVDEETDAVSFTVATNDGYRDKDTGEWIDNPPVFHDCTRFLAKGKGEKLLEMLTRGREVEVEGALSSSKPRKSTDNLTYHNKFIRVEEVRPGRKPQASQAAAQTASQAEPVA